MAITASKKNSRPSKRVAEQHQEEEEETIHSCFYHPIFLLSFLFRIPATIAVLIFIFLWSSSTTLISENMIRICVSSRKLTNSYCLYAQPQPNFQLPAQSNFQLPIPITNTTPSALSNTGEYHHLPQVTSSTSTDNFVPRNDSRANLDERTKGINAVEEQLQIHRSWAISGSSLAQVDTTCSDKGIFVYDLPTKFNKDILALCNEMIPWINFCIHTANNALGERLPKLGNGWYNTHQYSLEPIFHSRLLNHPCRVFNKDDAKLYYVPFYGGLELLRWHFKNVSTDVKDALGSELMMWLESQDSWNRNSGKDHVFVLGKISWDFRRRQRSSWGSKFLSLDQMENPIKLLIERQPWKINEIAIPHPTYFHPHSDHDITSWQSSILQKHRKTLISFAGGARPGMQESIRSILIKQCTSRNNVEQCKHLDCHKCSSMDCNTKQCDKPESVMELFMESEFCLQPPGDSPTRKSVFDSLVSGCIPVLFDPFTAYYQYSWHLPKEHDKYSVFIDQEDVRDMKVNVIEKLMKISLKQREDMRRYIVYELLPGLVYGDSDAKFELFQDAFSITINNLLHKFTKLDSSI